MILGIPVINLIVGITYIYTVNALCWLFLSGAYLTYKKIREYFIG